MFNFLQSYILDDQDIAKEFMNNHRLLSPSPGESQDPLSKSAASSLTHAERDGSSVSHWNQWELGQDECDGQNI